MREIDCMYRVFIISLIFSVFAGLPLKLLAGKPDKLFRSDEVLRIELRTDIEAIQKNRAGDPVFFDGELIYYENDGTSVKLNIRVSARGNFRLKPENCSFPPLLIDFRKSDVKNSVFEKQNRLKLVTPCQNEEDLLDEYIVYRLYNQVTSFSFRVRLARILYFDTSTGKPLFERYSFFIEDDDRMAERNDSKVYEKFVTPFDLDYESYKKLSVFQYIIGNKDWYVTSRKNIVIVAPSDSSMKPVAVPYDFDFSGLVDALYTRPKNLPGYTIGYRRGYKGICYSEAELKEVFDYYRRLKPVLLKTIKEEALLSSDQRYRLVDYINYSIALLRNRSIIKSEFLGKCETRELYNLSSY